jgi:hypothetical protein
MLGPFLDAESVPFVRFSGTMLGPVLRFVLGTISEPLLRLYIKPRLWDPFRVPFLAPSRVPCFGPAVEKNNRLESLKLLLWA